MIEFHLKINDVETGRAKLTNVETQYIASPYDEQHGWIDGYVDTWIDDPAKEHIPILGEFGPRKTWFTFNYAWNALLKYKQAKQKGLTRPRLPLVILG